jgi:H+/gluconate symporter-like permease
MNALILDEIEFGMDNGTMLIVGIFTVIFILVLIGLNIWEHIENKKAEEAAWEEWHKQKEEEAHLKAEMNFFENRIAEDMLNIGSKINTRLVELYREEV